MKKLSVKKIILFSNIISIILTFFLAVLLQKNEVRRRDQLIMALLIGDVSAYKQINSQRINGAINRITRNIELVVSERRQLSVYGYDNWLDIENDLIEEGILLENAHKKSNN